MQRDDVIWRAGGVPVSRRFDDPYFAVTDGLAETRHVFLGGNDLPARFQPGFNVAELGFGTGLNALAAWEAWQASGQAGDLRFTSFEAFPLEATAMARALDAWPALGDRAAALVAAWAGGARDIRLPGLRLHVVDGDARVTLPAWEGMADAWFLDGFAPSRNPEMWEAGLLAAVAHRTAPGGTFATYSAAGSVRARLAEAGFAVSRVPGFGRKRHMTRGVRRP
jgi:tRNA U34 5-methylaminomethyl-2-thiouridine-forming methyltransferase MnmC